MAFLLDNTMVQSNIAVCGSLFLVSRYMVCPIEIRETRGLRTLHFGSDWVQGTMRINRPNALELAYTREMMASLLLSASWPDLPKHILQIGLGAASLTRFIYANLPEAQQTVVELEPVVVGAAQQGFKLPPLGDRLQIEIAEGAAWMATATGQYDLILIDGFDAAGETGELESLAFYQDCRLRLAPGGLLVCNFLSLSARFLKSCIALDAAFHGQSRLLPQTPGGNVIALGAVSPTAQLDENSLRERAERLEADTGLDLNPLVERVLAQEDGMPFGV
jgi:spermidine synthase